MINPLSCVLNDFFRFVSFHHIYSPCCEPYALSLELRLPQTKVQNDWQAKSLSNWLEAIMVYDQNLFFVCVYEAYRAVTDMWFIFCFNLSDGYLSDMKEFFIILYIGLWLEW